MGSATRTAQVGPAHGHVTAFVGDRVFGGDPQAIPLTAHAQVQLDVGDPVVRTRPIAFPRGL